MDVADLLVSAVRRGVNMGADQIIVRTCRNVKSICEHKLITRLMLYIPRTEVLNVCEYCLARTYESRCVNPIGMPF